jgi:hypothetical protein
MVVRIHQGQLDLQKLASVCCQFASRVGARLYYVGVVMNAEISSLLLQRVGTAGAAVPVKLPGNGHLPSIGARFRAASCPRTPEKREQNGSTMAQAI